MLWPKGQPIFDHLMPVRNAMCCLVPIAKDHPIRPIIKAIYLYDNVSIRTLSMTSSTGCVLGLEDVLST